MSHRVNVGDSIKFSSEANRTANVKGNFCTDRITICDYFWQKTLDTTNNYNVTVAGDSDAIAQYTGGSPCLKVDTGTTDDNVCFLATRLLFDQDYNPEIESRLQIVDVDQTFVFFGFADAVTETTPDATIDAAGGTLTAIATDAVGFVIDADLATSSIYCCSVNNGGAVQYVDTGIDWTDLAKYNLRVKLDPDGDADFFINGKSVGHIDLAVADVKLCAMWNFGTREGGSSEDIYVVWFKAWQDVI